MSEEKKVDDKQLEGVTGASGVLSHLATNDGSGDANDGVDIGKAPPGTGSPGPEADGGGGGNEDLGI